MEYKELKSGIKDHLNSAAEDFFMVGYFLRQISDKALFLEDGYKSIWDFAKGEYGLSTSSASRFMAINARFSIDGGEHMAEKLYRDGRKQATGDAGTSRRGAGEGNTGNNGKRDPGHEGSYEGAAFILWTS